MIAEPEPRGETDAKREYAALKQRLLASRVGFPNFASAGRVAVGVVFSAWWAWCTGLPGYGHSRSNSLRFQTRQVGSGQTLVRSCDSGHRVEYIGSAVCAECHPDIYESFRKTRMGHSMTVSRDAVEASMLELPATVHEPSLDRYFQAYAEGGELYQSEYQLSPDGPEVFRETEKIAYVVGAGQTGYGFLVAKGQYLFEAPLSYYTRVQHWELSPGYQYADYGFDRPVLAECVSCHSGRTRPVSGRNGMYENPPFQELSVGCENCHGPGALHVEQRRKAAPIEGSVDSTIVNPAKLSPWLANNICMACHENGDDRVAQPGKTSLDYCPGTPLDDTIGVFSVPLKRGAEDKSPLLQHYSLMILSKCYLQSGGELTCVTCHDPHVEPEGTQGAEFYRGKCLGCHTEASCGLALAARMKQTPADDCAGCHMPKRKSAVISHSALTNHRIVSRTDEPLPEVAFHQTTPDLPDLVHLSALGQKRPKPVNSVVLLHVYADLIPHFPEYQKPHDDLLRELAKNGSSDPFVLAELARRGLRENQPESLKAAADYLTKALQEGSNEPTDFEMLANLLEASGKNQEATELLKRGIELNPYSMRLYKMLALHYIKIAEYGNALAIMKEELEIFPHDSLMRGLIKRVEENNR